MLLHVAMVSLLHSSHHNIFEVCSKAAWCNAIMQKPFNSLIQKCSKIIDTGNFLVITSFMHKCVIVFKRL